jgi:hypothetical protein
MKQLKTSSSEEELIQKGMFYCPYGKENYHCFFLWLQKRSLKQKTEWYKCLTAKDKKELILCHQGCKEGRPMNLNKIKVTQNN